ncbi:MAG: PIN domain-containing protein [Polaromonas sp.]
MIAFLDSNALIYYFEGAQSFRQAVVDVLQSIKASDAQAQVAVSRLGVMECRVKPLRDGNQTLLAQYDNFFNQVQIVELSAAIVTHATDIRATMHLKTPDALQAACALSLGDSCVFVTGDEGFARVQGLKLRQISVVMR